MEDSPDTPKNIAYAIATQQGHKVGKSPKGFRTPEGVREAKKKYELPKKEYQKTAGDDTFRGRPRLLSPEERKMIRRPTMLGTALGAGAGLLVPGKLKAPAAVLGGVAGGLVGGRSGSQAAAKAFAARQSEQEKTSSITLRALFNELDKLGEELPGYIGPIEEQTEENRFFRRVLFTGKYAQLVLMSIAVGEDIGEEAHDDIDQFFRIDGGEGVVVMNGVQRPVQDGDAFLVPAGIRHNVINTSETEPLQLYSVYSPPHHPPDTIHETKADAESEKTASGGAAALGGELLGLPGSIYGGLREGGLRGAAGAGLGGAAGLGAGIGARHLIQKYLTGGEFGRKHPIAATIAESLPLAVGSTVGGAVGSQLLRR